MKVAICTKRDLTSAVLLNDLMPQLSSCDLEIILAERTRPVELSRPSLQRIKYLERDLPIGELGLDRLPPQGPDCLLGFAALGRRYQAPVHVAASWAEAEQQLLSFTPELVISIRFSFAFREPVLSLCPLGIINVHPGRIPEYAGLYPHFYSLLAGEKSLGCTVHYVDDSIDGGPILAEGAVPIDLRRSAFRHNLESHLLGNRLLAGLMNRIRQGIRLEAAVQASPAAKPNTYPEEDKFAQFHAAGLSLIHMDEYMEILRRFGVATHFAEDPTEREVAAGMFREG